METEVTNKKGPKIGLNIGASSILVVFILLCLVTFAVLSLVSANADFKLSKKTADHTTAYYEATAKAERQLAHIVAEGKENPEVVEYTVPISDTQQLHVIAMVPGSFSTEKVQILSWMVENIGDWNTDERILLYDTNVLDTIDWTEY